MKKRVIVIFDTADDTYLGHGDNRVPVPAQARQFPVAKGESEEDAISGVWEKLKEAGQFSGTLQACPMIHYDSAAADVLVPFRPTGSYYDRLAEFEKLPAPIRAFCGRVTSGTTTAACDLNVLYFGRHVALINHRGGSYSDNGGSHYMPGWVERINIDTASRHRGDGFKCKRTVSVFDNKKDGKLTEERVQRLVLDAMEFDFQFPKLLEAEKAEKQEQRDLIAKKQEEQRAYWEAVAKQAEAVGGKAIIATSFDRDVLGAHDNINGTEMVHSAGRVEIGPFVIRMHACYRVKEQTGGEWEIDGVDVNKDALPSAEPLTLLSSLPALPFKKEGA